MQRDAQATMRETLHLQDAVFARAVLGRVQSLTTSVSRPLSEFSGQRIHAVAGIGNPSAFFSMLRENGLQVVEHPFPDHAALTKTDLAFADADPVLMTHKDAVRCRSFADERMWAVHMEVEIDPSQAECLLREIQGIVASHPRNPYSK
jgi:tetraacyldisaccharide 4'-kinase